MFAILGHVPEPAGLPPRSAGDRGRGGWGCVLLLGLMFAVGGCHRVMPPSTANESESSLAAASVAAATATQEATRGAFPMTVTDALDRRVTFARPPQRIVSLSPKNTECLFALGAGEKVVGVTNHCDYPPEAESRESVGGFTSTSLSLEKIVSLQPDLVLSVGALHAPVINDLERLGIPVLALAADSFDELCQELEMLGDLVGHTSQATQRVQEIRNRIARVQQLASQIPEGERLRAFYRTWEQPLMVAGPETYIGKMIELCGAVNIIEEPTPVRQISEEVVLHRNPDAMLLPSFQATLAIERLHRKPGWERISAVRNGRIHPIEDDLVSRCGPRLIEGLEAMAQALYPEHFASLQGECPSGEAASTPRLLDEDGSEVLGAGDPRP